MAKKVIIFILVTIAGFYTLNYTYDYFIRKNDFNKVWWLDHIKNKEYDFAFLGHSRVYTMIQTDTLEKYWNKKGINISLDGSNISQQYLMLYLFLKNGNTVKDVYYNIDFNEFENHLNNEMRVWCFLPYIYDDVVYTELGKAYGEKRAFCWRYLPFYKNVEFNSKIGFLSVANSIIKLEKKPFNKYGDFKGISNHKGKIGRNYQPNNIYPQLLNLEEFRNILTICKKNNIRLHLYTTPVWKETREGIMNIDMIKNRIILPLAKEYGATYEDFTFNPLAENRDLFLDNTHFNSEGVNQWMKYVEKFPH